MQENFNLKMYFYRIMCQFPFNKFSNNDKKKKGVKTCQHM